MNTAAAQMTGTTTLRRILMRAVAPVAIGVVVGALLALVVTLLLPKRYTAASRVLVSATGVDSTAQANARTSGVINLDTEAQLVTSAAVIDDATSSYRALSQLTFEKTVADITVSVPPNSSVLVIAFTADTPEMARSASNALAAAYLNDRQGNAQDLLDRQKSQARQTVRSLTSDLEQVSNQLADLPGSSSRRGLLETQIGILKTQIDGENSQIVSLGSVQITPGRVVTAASLPTHPSSPSRTVNALSGAGLGLVLGLLVAWLLLRFTRTVRRPDDLARVVDVPYLATLDGRGSAEQYRHLALVAGASVREPRRLVFAGPLDSPAANQVATAVAEALTRGGRSTALLRVNVGEVHARRPLGVPVESRPSTDTIAPGLPLDAGLDQVRGDQDLLVIAAGGAAVKVDAAALGCAADAVVLVVDSGARSRDVHAAVSRLDEVGAPILGVVLARGLTGTNDARTRRTMTAPGSQSQPGGSSLAEPTAEPTLRAAALTEPEPAPIVADGIEPVPAEPDLGEAPSGMRIIELAPPHGVDVEATIDGADDDDTDIDLADVVPDDAAIANEDADPAESRDPAGDGDDAGPADDEPTGDEPAGDEPAGDKSPNGTGRARSRSTTAKSATGAAAKSGSRGGQARHAATKTGTTRSRTASTSTSTTRGSSVRRAP